MNLGTAMIDPNPRPGEESWDVFISHSQYANGWVRRFAAELREYGLGVFVDADDIGYGAKIEDRIRFAIRHSRHILCALTSAVQASEWCAWESAVAVKAKRRLIPVLVDNTPIEQVDPKFRVRKYANLNEPQAEANLKRWLVKDKIGTKELTCYVIRSRHNVSDVDVRALKENLLRRHPNCSIEVIEVEPSGSCRIAVLADFDVSETVHSAEWKTDRERWKIESVEVVPIVHPLEFQTETRRSTPSETRREFSDDSSSSEAIELLSDSSTRQLRERAERAFRLTSPRQAVGNRKAIVGPRRLLELIDDAEAARQALATGQNPSPLQRAALEQAIRLQRPAPACRFDGPTPLPIEGNWLAEIWHKFQPTLQKLQRSVARLDRVDDPDRKEQGRSRWGSAFLVEPELLMTAAHVVDQLSFCTGELGPDQAIAEFAGYEKGYVPEHRRVLAVVALDRRLDLALLRIEPFDAADGSRPTLMDEIATPTVGAPVCAVGYPLEDSRNPPALITSVFGANFGVKRAAVGEIIETAGELFYHDCSTLGGVSGGPVVDLESGRLCGVHVSGQAMIRNAAVPASSGRAFFERCRSRAPIASFRVASRPSRSASSFRSYSWTSRSGQMDQQEKTRRLADYLKKVAPDGDIESLAPKRGGTFAQESFAPLEACGGMEVADRAVERVSRHEIPNEQERYALEAIILPGLRPAIFIQDDSFEAPPDLFAHFGEPPIRRRIEKAIRSVGRVEVPKLPQYPYAGTAFIVGDNLLMTNRHVAALFATGLGSRNLGFQFGQEARCSLRREHDPSDLHNGEEGPLLKVEEIVMIHPYWDMALLKVDRLPPGVKPLMLSTKPPEDYAEEDIAVIGYPALDPRNDARVQNDVFQSVFNVKRLMPGKLKERRNVASFDYTVNSATHDSSTLGGVSGAAVVAADDGMVIGLHFGGRYLDANYAVSTYDLARDRRVVDAGVNFDGSVKPTSDWDHAWKEVHPDETLKHNPPQDPRPHDKRTQARTGESRVVSVTVPVTISVSLGEAKVGDATGGESVDLAEAFRMQTPVIYPDLDSRDGFDPAFLQLKNGMEIALPQLTGQGKRQAAKLDDGSYELRYHKHSIVMHKKRRLALFTAANVDWRRESREIDGRKPSRKELTGLPEGSAEQWVTDPRIPEAHQLPDVFYTKDGAAFDKGHLIRRDDVCWGESFEEIQKANGDTYFTTNCSPQALGFNRSASGKDNWGDLENLIQKETKAERAILLAGPVLSEKDKSFRGLDKRGEVLIQIPRAFWKIVVVAEKRRPAAYGFVLEQDLSDVEIEFAVPDTWRKFVKPIEEIEELLGGSVKLDDLKAYDRSQELDA